MSTHEQIFLQTIIVNICSWIFGQTIIHIHHYKLQIHKSPLKAHYVLNECIAPITNTLLFSFSPYLRISPESALCLQSPVGGHTAPGPWSWPALKETGQGAGMLYWCPLQLAKWDPTNKTSYIIDTIENRLCLDWGAIYCYKLSACSNKSISCRS